MAKKKFPDSYYKKAIKQLLAQEQILKETGNPEEILENSLKMLSELLQLDRGRIFLWDDYKQQLQIQYSYNLSELEKARGRYEICEGITGEVFDTGKSALIADLQMVPNYKGKVTPRSVTLDSPISYIAVPISFNDSTFGVLAIESANHHDGDLEANAMVLKLVAEMLGRIVDAYSLCDFATAA